MFAEAVEFGEASFNDEGLGGVELEAFGVDVVPHVICRLAYLKAFGKTW